MIQNFQRKRSEDEEEEKESPQTKEIENKFLDEEAKGFALDEKKADPKEEAKEIKPNLFNFDFSQKKLAQKIKFVTGEYKILSIRFDPMDNFIALGCEDGHVRIFQKDKENCLINLFEDSPNIPPATCVRWRPFNQNTKNILITGHTDGSVNHWHATSKKILHSFVEQNNHVYAMDFKEDGTVFVTGGRDGEVRLYDENKISKMKILEEGVNTPTHKNRIYGVKFLTDDPNLLISGGWDKVVLLWDIRTGKSENFLYGPMICGDSLDYKNGKILTGSWRSEDQLELWDMKMMKRVEVIKWVEFDENILNNQKSFIYTCQFQKGKGNCIVAGSTGNNEIRIFDVNKNFECIDGIRGLDQGVFSVDWANVLESGMFAYAGGNGLCGLITV